jgi:hypothetical protein
VLKIKIAAAKSELVKWLYAGSNSGKSISTLVAVAVACGSERVAIKKHFVWDFIASYNKFYAYAMICVF